MLHDEQREKDLQKLCRRVINTSPITFYNPNGADDATCPFCYAKTWDVNAGMEDIKHKLDCEYLIAKDLLTNIN